MASSIFGEFWDHHRFRRDVKAHLLVNEMSIREVAEFSGVSLSSLAAWLRDERRGLSIDTYAALARFCYLHMDEYVVGSRA